VAARTTDIRLPLTLTVAAASLPRRPTQYKSIKTWSVWDTIATSMKLEVFSRCGATAIRS
jgi:hypothetical protein